MTVVMSRTTRTKYATAEVPVPFPEARAVPIEAAGSATEVADQIRQGKAFLKVVESPWGVDFYIVEAEVEA